MSDTKDEWLGQMALGRNLITREQLDGCLEQQGKARAQGLDIPLGQIFLRRRLIDVRTLGALLQEQRIRERVVPHFGRYEILERLGRGATAEVFAGWDRELERAVAIKFLREEIGMEATARGRFLREGRAMGRLQHPNVVAVFDVGEAGGRTYLVMERVRGESLRKTIDRRLLPLQDLVGILEGAARGVGEAHRSGIIHRDLKPENILITEQGIPKVADFGLARLIEAQTSMTRTGTTLGTPYYMSPEQAQGRKKDMGPATDVYSLGILLYEILAGRSPFEGVSPIDLFEKVIQEMPPPPHTVNPKAPPDLEAVCMRAVQKEPNKRYCDADTFADELTRVREGKRVDARPVSLLGKLWRRARGG